MSVFVIKTPASMRVLGAKLAEVSSPGLVIYLQGELGSGKTTLVRGFLQALGYAGQVKSPTFTLVESYHVARTSVHHFDLYRLTDPGELEYLGVRDYFSNHTICLIEWPERGAGFLPPPDLICEFSFDQIGRRVQMRGCKPKGDKLLSLI